MPLFIKEDSKKLNKRQIVIPDGVAKKLHQNMNMYSNEKTSDGYKRLNALTNKDYNKRSNKKDAQHNDKMTVSFGDAKRIVHDMEHMPQTPKNKEFNMIGGYDTMYALKNSLKQARSSVKQVNPVPQVPKLEKNPTKIANPKDDVKMGSLNVHINENIEDFYEDYYSEKIKKTKNSKTIYLTEAQLKKLIEYHNQLKIPFSDPSKPYDLKDNYEHFIDYLESIGKYGQLPVSRYKGEDYSEFMNNDFEGLLNAFRTWAESYELNGVRLFLDFMNRYWQNDTLFNGDELKNLRNICQEKGELTVDDLISINFVKEYELDDFEKHIDSFDLTHPDSTILTPEGKNTFKNEILQPEVEEFIQNHIVYNWTIDDRGLIAIERAITVPDMFANWVNTESGVTQNDNNYYNTLSFYPGIGVCWTYSEGYSEAYCGDNYEAGTYMLTLYGYVDPKDVNWSETLILNLNNPEEFELRLKNNALVEIDRVTFDDSRNKLKKFKFQNCNLPLKGPIIVKTNDVNERS